MTIIFYFNIYKKCIKYNFFLYYKFIIMERNRKEEHKSFSSSPTTKSDKNNVNISVSIGNNDNLQEDKSINIKEQIEEPKIFDKNEEKDELEMDNLVNEIRLLIDSFNEKNKD